MNIETAKELLRKSNGAGMYDVWIPSLKKAVQFKHMTAGQRKSVSKISMEYEGNATRYQFAKLALIDELSLDPTLKAEALTDADFVCVTAALRRNNVLTPLQLKSTCSKCDKPFTFDVDFDDMDRRARAYEQKVFSVSKSVGGVDFSMVVSDPLATSVIEFGQVTLEASKHGDASDDYARFQLLNYPLQFVKELSMNGELVEGFETMGFFDRVQFFDEFVPGDVTLDEKDGLAVKVYESFLPDRLDTLFQDVSCPHCGDKKEGLVTADSFFTI